MWRPVPEANALSAMGAGSGFFRGDCGGCLQAGPPQPPRSCQAHGRSRSAHRNTGRALPLRPHRCEFHEQSDLVLKSIRADVEQVLVVLPVHRQHVIELLDIARRRLAPTQSHSGQSRAGARPAGRAHPAAHRRDRRACRRNRFRRAWLGPVPAPACGTRLPPSASGRYCRDKRREHEFSFLYSTNTTVPLKIVMSCETL